MRLYQMIGLGIVLAVSSCQPLPAAARAVAHKTARPKPAPKITPSPTAPDIAPLGEPRWYDRFRKLEGSFDAGRA